MNCGRRVCGVCGECHAGEVWIHDWEGTKWAGGVSPPVPVPVHSLTMRDVPSDGQEAATADVHPLWKEHCRAALDIKKRFGLDRSLDYLVGEKFRNYVARALLSAKPTPGLRPFAAEIRALFPRAELKRYLDQAPWMRPSVRSSPNSSPIAGAHEMAVSLQIGGLLLSDE